MNMNDTETEDKIDSHSYIPFRITASTTYPKDTVTATATATATTQITKKKKIETVSRSSETNRICSNLKLEYE